MKRLLCWLGIHRWEDEYEHEYQACAPPYGMFWSAEMLCWMPIRKVLVTIKRDECARCGRVK